VYRRDRKYGCGSAKITKNTMYSLEAQKTTRDRAAEECMKV
jgi:hypothetical protein